MCLAESAENAEKTEKADVYERVEEYDPVLRSHCRLDGKAEVIFPSAAGKRGPARVV